MNHSVEGHVSDSQLSDMEVGGLSGVDGRLRGLPLEGSSVAYHSVPSSVTSNDDGNESSEEEPTPVPWRYMVVAMMIVLSEGFASYLLMSFVAFMVLDFGYAPDDVGYVAGLITSCYYCTQALTCYSLGSLSDRFGRKPLLLISMASNAVCALAFGMSTSLPMALAIRAVNGCLNGNIGVVKSFLRDISDESNQSRLFALREVANALGLVMAPFVGGFLSRPAHSWPRLFSARVWTRFPYLLPCIVSSLVNVVCFVVGVCFLRESKKWDNNEEEEEEAREDELHVNDDDCVEMTSLLSSHNTEAEEGAGARGVGVVHEDEDEDEEEEEEVSLCVEVEDEDDAIAAPGGAVGAPLVPRQGGAAGRLPSWCPGGGGAPSVLRRLWGAPNVMFTLSLYMTQAFLYLAFDEVFSVWALRTPSHGGLGFDEWRMGLAYATSGVSMGLFMLLLFPPLARRFGARSLWLYLLLCQGGLYLLLPALNRVATTPWLLWTSLVVGMAVKTSAGIGAFSVSTILINNAISSDLAGAVNGLGASLAAIMRVLAPVTAGSLFALTAGGGAGFPFNWYCVFWILCGLSWAGALVVMRLPKHVNKRNPNDTLESAHVQMNE